MLNTHIPITERLKRLPFIHYWAPLLLIVCATALKFAFIGLLGYKAPFLLYFGAVIVTARYFGVRSAVIATLLSAIASVFFLQAPDNTADIMRTGIFVLECCLMISFSRELKRAGKQIMRNERRFRAMIEKGSEGIVMLDINGKHTYASPSVQYILGYTPDEFLQLSAWQLEHEDELTMMKEEFYKLTGHQGQTKLLSHRMQHKEGHWVWVESTITNLLHEPSVGALVCNFTDVTKRVLEERRQRDFISIASHELKAPLTTLKAYSQILFMRCKRSGNDSDLQLVHKLDDQVSKVVAMSTNLLDVARINAGKLLPDKAEFDIYDVILQIVESLRHTSVSHQILVEATSTLITADKQGVAQVITNLLTNAIKYSPNGKQVKLAAKVEDRKLTLSVRDYGIGIPEDEKTKIFDRLYRAKQVSAAYSGLGLGLYISTQIIEQHGGTMGVMSKVGEGSEFWFQLPV